jgi:plasmid stabilization system protein ParE
LKVEFSRLARDDLFSIRDYIADSDPRIADQIALRILQSIRHLARFPEFGSEWSNTGTRALSIPGLPYRVHYRIAGQVVEIITVVHTRRKLPF